MSQEDEVYYSQDERMIAAQARHISKFRNEILMKDEHILKLSIENREYRNDAVMYRKIMEEVQKEPTLQEIWTQLVVTMKLLGVKFD